MTHQEENNIGFSYSIYNGKLDTIRRQTVPQGIIKVFGIEDIAATNREITIRAIQMTAGIFHFAEQSNRKEP